MDNLDKEKIAFAHSIIEDIEERLQMNLDRAQKALLRTADKSIRNHEVKQEINSFKTALECCYRARERYKIKNDTEMF